jgi:hypothetical protein
MKQTLFLFNFLYLNFLGNIQAQTYEFGKITAAEVKAKTHPLDTSAVAVYLCKTGKIYTENKVFKAPRSVFEQYQKIKILKKAGYSYANVDIPYVSGVLKIAELKASSYNWEDGKIVETKVNEEDIIKETLSKNFNLKRLSFKSIREGSVIEVFFKWVAEETSAIPDWQFQNRIPTVWSEFSIKRQGWQNTYDYDTRIQGVIPCKHDEKRYSQNGDSVIVTSWVQRDIPSFEPEVFMGAEKDNISKLEFIYANDWTSVAWKLGFGYSFGKVVNDRNEDIVVETRIPILGLKEQKDKMLAIYKYIGKNYKIDEKNKGLGMTRPIEELIKKREGSKNELNLLYINMLRIAGIKALSALFCTRDHGRVKKDYADASQFNRVLAYVELSDSSKWYLDVASIEQPLGLIPFEFQNGDAFVLQENFSYLWQPIEQKVASKNYNVANLTINNEGKVKGEIKSTYTAYDAVNMRQSLKKQTPKEVVNDLFKDLLLDGKIDSFQFEKPNAIDSIQLKATYYVQSSGYSSKTDDKLYIQPLFCFIQKDNPFKGDKRLYDIYLDSEKEDIIILNFTIPDKYKIEELPLSSRIAFEDNGLSYNYGIDVQGKNLKITSRFRVKRTLYKSAEFSDLKKLYNQMISKMSEQIVLVVQK